MTLSVSPSLPIGINGQRAAGVAIGFAGVIVLVVPAAVEGLKTDLSAYLAVLAAACSYAGAGIFGRRFQELAPSVAALGMLGGASVLLIPLAILAERPEVTWPETRIMLAAGGLALFSTALAYIIYFRVLAVAGATNLLLVTFLIPVSALVFGAVALDESIEGHALFGMGLIAIGLAAIDSRALLWLSRRAPTIRRGGVESCRRPEPDLDYRRSGAPALRHKE